jgi:protein-disulfide isomerase
MSRKTKKTLPNSDRQDPLLHEAMKATGPSRRHWVIGAIVALLVAIGAWVLVQNSADTPSPTTANPVMDEALSSAQSPTLGDPNAKVHIVEFLDPACETCAQFYPLVKKLVADHPGQIRVSLRHVAFHEGSEYVVRVLEASRKQDKYWPTLEAVLVSQAMWAPNHTAQPDLVLQAIADVGLNMAQLMTDMDAPDVAQRVEQDRNDAIAMKVTATPEYFVNGRPLPSFGEQQLLSLVREELQNAY